MSNLTPKAIIQNAQQAEAVGVPVDWKLLFIRYAQAAEQEVQTLQQGLMLYEQACKDLYTSMSRTAMSGYGAPLMTLWTRGEEVAEKEAEEKKAAEDKQDENTE